MQKVMGVDNMVIPLESCGKQIQPEQLITCYLQCVFRVVFLLLIYLNKSELPTKVAVANLNLLRKRFANSGNKDELAINELKIIKSNMLYIYGQTYSMYKSAHVSARL